MAIERTTGDWVDILESAEEYRESGTHDETYLPVDDISYLMGTISDPRHQAISYVMQETSEGETVSRDEVLEFLDDSPTTTLQELPENIVEELSSEGARGSYDPGYIEENEGGLSISRVPAEDKLGAPIVASSGPVASTVAEYLEERRYSEGFIGESQIKEDIIPNRAKGILTNHPLSFWNEEIKSYGQRRDVDDPSEYAVDISLLRLSNSSMIASRRDGDENKYKSVLDDVQRGILSEMNPEDGDHGLVMTGPHRSRIVPREHLE